MPHPEHGTRHVRYHASTKDPGRNGCLGPRAVFALSSPGAGDRHE